VLACVGKLWHQPCKLVRRDLYHEGDVLPGQMLGSYQEVTIKSINKCAYPLRFMKISIWKVPVPAPRSLLPWKSRVERSYPGF
jgi:hypothetical protein